MEKRITIPALLYVIKIHKYHHVTVRHRCGTAHNHNGDRGKVLLPLIHEWGSLQPGTALRYTPIRLPNSRGSAAQRASPEVQPATRTELCTDLFLIFHFI